MLGKTATAYTAVTGGTYDKNTTYYLATFSEATVNEVTFTTNGTLFTKNASEQYAAVTSGSYDSTATYYKATYEQTAITAEQFATYNSSTTSGENPVANTNYGKLFTATNTAVYGTITGGAAVKTLSNYEVKTSLELTTNLAAGDQVDIVALVWLDGAMLTDSRQGDVGNVSLLFSAS